MLFTHNAVEVAVVRVGVKRDAPWSRSRRLERLHIPDSPFWYEALVCRALRSTGHADAYQERFHLRIAGILAHQADGQTPDHTRNVASDLPAKTGYDGRKEDHSVHGGYTQPSHHCRR